MKFGKTLATYSLQNPRYKNYFIGYKELKHVIKELREKKRSEGTGAGASSASVFGGGESQFQVLLNRELDKINKFVELQTETLEGELRRYLYLVNKKVASEEEADSVESALDNIADEIVFLEAFIRINFTGFRKITKKCDKNHGTSISRWFMSRVSRERFMQAAPDRLLGHLGMCYKEWRHHCQILGLGDRRAKGFPKDSPEPPADLKQTATFWMNPTQTTRAKALILKYMDTDDAAERKASKNAMDASRSLKPGFSKAAGIAKQRTHVYFDNPRGTQYLERFRRQLGRIMPQHYCGAVVCFSWIGENDGTDEQEIVVETEDSEGFQSATLKQREAKELLDGTLQGDGAASVAAQEIRDDRLRPSLSVVLSRATFEEDDRTQISVDDDLRFLLETDPPKGQWCSAPKGSETTMPDGVVSFPYSVLTIRGRRPTWFAEVELLTMTEILGFSKGIHGASVLTNASRPGLAQPPWLADMDGGAPSAAPPSAVPPLPVFPISPPVKQASPSETPTAPNTGAAKVADSPGIFRRIVQGCAKPCTSCFDTKAQRALVSVDPKTLLSNERTLLRWLRTSVLLSSMSVALVGLGDTAVKINGIMLGILALIFALWPLSNFIKRKKQLEAKVPLAYVDRVGPQVQGMALVVILSAVLLVNVLSKSQITTS